MKLFALSLCVVAACGNSNDPDDPLTGKWSNSTCNGSTALPENTATCASTISFDRDLTMSFEWTAKAPPASSTNARCLTRHFTNGKLTWSTGVKNNLQTASISGSASPKVEVKDCLDSINNKDAVVDGSLDFPAGDYTYDISGKTLTIRTAPNVAIQGTYVKN